MNSKKKEKADMKAYKREEKARKKILKKSLKSYSPYDYFYTASIISLLKYQKDYFEKNHNVHEVDESRLEIIDELNEALALFNKASSYEDLQYVTSSHFNDEHYKKFLSEAYLYVLTHQDNWWD